MNTPKNPEIVFNPSRLHQQVEDICSKLVDEEILQSSIEYPEQSQFIKRIVMYGMNAKRPAEFDWFAQRNVKLTVSIEIVDVSTDGFIVRMNPVISYFRVSKVYGPQSNNPVPVAECHRITDEINAMLGLKVVKP